MIQYESNCANMKASCVVSLTSKNVFENEIHLNVAEKTPY
jgi:hypothetical protein